MTRCGCRSSRPCGLDDWDSTCGRLREQHHGIYEAIAAGEADRAADLAEAHIRQAQAELRTSTGG